MDLILWLEMYIYLCSNLWVPYHVKSNHMRECVGEDIWCVKNRDLLFLTWKPHNICPDPCVCSRMSHGCSLVQITQLYLFTCPLTWNVASSDMKNSTAKLITAIFTKISAIITWVILCVLENACTYRIWYGFKHIWSKMHLTAKSELFFWAIHICFLHFTMLYSDCILIGLSQISL